MDNRLYVGNLTEDVSSEALRRRFAEVAEVSDVTLAVDRSSGRMRGYAFVTMTTLDGARAAIERLNGAMFDERPLRVNEAGEEREGSRAAKDAKKHTVRITMQFRERSGMMYELDCAGVLIGIRIIPSTPDEKEWRIEASLKNVVGEGSDEVIGATAPKRAEAIEELAKTWQTASTDRGLRAVDWTAIREALAAVRAI